MTVFELLQNALDASTLRQAVYANNIANAETPGYKRQDVAFETLLQNALSGQASGALGEAQIPIGGDAPSYDLNALPDVTPVVYTDPSTTVNSNGNNVDITEEMVLLAENQVRYDTLVQVISGRLYSLRTAITGS
ncbi:flagellar basal body rod protein FlgB [Alicyclobacillus acidocaldarius]|uniref:Flagellar basal body rod protein FlgB n=1 Tax=Alicyclobacillus acidocaldarius subsp. acidocaldarius (strain ATCC 27009 / DSM 446 / BCRC 14685 / JCM 5260 / KCTC 1825 / NBRC 15652 / NCIMB 11725 / NRRL B-14509 / 104-IA) TaxID=521098 RepID=C8WVN1_ALIAD|nr:flagellar basal body rod protein FlgB [Alicyclobacillus acidocaldarius]ACV58153.1 flagellar basal-body rod protein FlgB [Alicyclobacillus acidocaldarius subsp. acidocaldarius DSM 446]